MLPKVPVFFSMDLKDFFLASPMAYNKYMKVQYSIIPNDIREQYNLADKVTSDSYVFIKINTA